MEDEEDIEHVEDDGGEQAKETHVAAKIKEFADKTSSDAGDGEIDESNKDYTADDGVDAVLPSVAKGEKRLDSAFEASTKLWKQWLTW